MPARSSASPPVVAVRRWLLVALGGLLVGAAVTLTALTATLPPGVEAERAWVHTHPVFVELPADGWQQRREVTDHRTWWSSPAADVSALRLVDFAVPHDDPDVVSQRFAEFLGADLPLQITRGQWRGKTWLTQNVHHAWTGVDAHGRRLSFRTDRGADERTLRVRVQVQSPVAR